MPSEFYCVEFIDRDGFIQSFKMYDWTEGEAIAHARRDLAQKCAEMKWDFADFQLSRVMIEDPFDYAAFNRSSKLQWDAFGLVMELINRAYDCRRTHEHRERYQKVIPLARARFDRRNAAHAALVEKL